MFQKATLFEEKLIPFGFRKENGRYVYEESFMGGDFLARIEIRDGRVEGKVIDVALGEEYAAINVSSFAGGYVGEVREAYKEILARIKNACFNEAMFLSPQANEIAALIAERFGEYPDHPFTDMENYGVFRYPATKKWYGLIMNVAKAKVTHDETDEGNVDVLNLKVDPEAMDGLVRIDGIVPAYHMNHKSWVSVLLDGRVDNELVMELLSASREFAMKGKKK